MAAESLAGRQLEKGMTAGLEFARRFSNLLIELRLQHGIHQRIERVITEFVQEHPRLRAAYISRQVDAGYFSDGSCGWEAAARPRLQGIAIADDHLFEFLAFSQGLRTYTTTLSSVMNVEELWLETAPDQPFSLRVCLYHSFPATTILTAGDSDSQEEALSFLRRLKYLRGF